MFQKLKQKLKSSKLLQKILSLFTILVVLSSMLVIPSSAADPGLTTLEGTTFEFKANEWTANAGYGSFDLQFYVLDLNGSNFEYIFENFLRIGFGPDTSDDFPFPVARSNEICLWDSYPLYVTNSDSFIIQFVGGSDIADPDLISWVTENGKQVLPNHVDPITDVFTGITSWITSALGIVTGVFYQKPDIETFTVASTGTTLNLTFDGSSVSQTWYLVSDFPLDISSFSPETSVFCSYDLNGTTYETSLISSFNNFVGCSVVTENWSTEFIEYEGNVYSSSLPGATFSIYNGGSSGLTFLGTLAVIGVSLAIIFLFIGVISNFLKNRG